MATFPSAHQNESAAAPSARAGARPQRRILWPALFLALNAAGLGLILWQVSEPGRASEAFAVADASPRGQRVPVDIGRVVVRFSAPIDAATVQDDTLKLTPHARGKTILHGDRELRFELDEKLHKATRYRVVVSPELRGASGARPAVEHIDFSTPALAVVRVSQAGIEAGESLIIAVAFNGPVRPEELARHLKLTYPNGKPVPFEPVGGMTDSELRVRVRRAKWSEIKLRIGGKLTGTQGPIPLGKAYETSVTVTSDLRFLGMTVASGRKSATIKVRMNSAIEASAAGPFVEVTPSVKHVLRFSRYGLNISGPFKPGTRYTVSLKPGLPAGAAGTLKKDVTRAVWVPDRPKSVGFTCAYGYLSPGGLLKVPIRSVNMKSVELTEQRLYANNIVEFAICDDGWLPLSLSVGLPARTIPIKAGRNETAETLVDLQTLGGWQGPGVYGLGLRDSSYRWRNDDTIIVVTDLGLSARMSKQSAAVWVTSISTAKVVEGARVTVYSDKRRKLGTAVSGPDGVAGVALAAMPIGEAPALILAEKAGDLTFMALDQNERPGVAGSSSGRPYLAKGYEVFVCAERGVYRPGDVARISGLVRGTAFKTPPKMPLELVVAKPDGRTLLKKTVTSESSGRLLADVKVPYAAPSGRYVVSCRLLGSKTPLGKAELQVADYIPRTLRMRLSATDEPLPVAKELKVAAHVEHLFGDPAVGLKIKCRARYRAAEFRPKDWDGYVFGDAREEVGRRTIDYTPTTLDKNGDAVFELKAPHLSTPAAIEAAIDVEVQEPGGRAMIETISRRFDPSKFYLGVSAPELGVSPNMPAEFAIAAVQPDGTAHAAAGAYTATLFRVTYSNVLRRQGERLEYEWTRKDTLVATQKGKFADGRASATFMSGHPGPYRLVVESAGGCSVTSDFYVNGATDQWAVTDPEQLKLTLDRSSYKPGETAKLSVQAPFGGTALVCLVTDRVLRHIVFDLPNGKGEVEFTVDETWRPNVYATATVVRPVTPEDEWRPHRASGIIRLDVDCEDRKLQLIIDSPSVARPEREIEIGVRVAARGKARAGAAIVLAAVDEGVLALTEHEAQSPWDFFFAPRRLGVWEYDMFSRLAPELSSWRVGKKADPGGDGGSGGKNKQAEMTRRLNPIFARRVKTAVLYAGTLTADVNGLARAKFTVPEYVGELRLMAWAADGAEFGSARKVLPVKSPIMARSSWPRVLAPGDEFELPVTVFNRTPSAGRVQIKLTSEGPLAPVGALPGGVDVPAGGEKTVRLRLLATGVGKVAARISVSLGEESYRESVEIPVRPAVAFARVGGSVVVEGPEEKEITPAGGLLPGTAKSSLVIAGTPAVELSGALEYLLSYPYGCVEQTTSKLVPLVYLRDLAELAHPGSLRAEETDEILRAGFLRLRMMQTSSGGLAMWPGGRTPYPWGSLYAADLLVEAKKAGISVPGGLLNPLLDYIAEQMSQWGAARRGSSLPGRPAELAYGCYVLARAGRPAYTWMGRIEDLLLHGDAGQAALPSSMRSHLAGAYLAAGQTQTGRKFLGDVRLSATKRQTGGSLNSPVREAAMMLSILLDLGGEAKQTAALAHRLKSNLKLGRWGTTQENAFALMALGKYARRLGPQPDAKISVTMPDGTVRTFRVKAGLRVDSIKPGQSVKIKVEGTGKAYVFWSTEGVPKKGIAKEEDSGLAIRRSFLSADGKSLADPKNLVQGQLYQVRLVVHATNSVDNIAVTDLLPSGLEVESPNLKGSARLRVASRRPARSGEGVVKVASPAAKWMRTEHVERRDDRVLIFTRLRSGASEFRYLVRAVTSGTFVLPAAEASCMYDPGIYSVSGRGTVRVIR